MNERSSHATRIPSTKRGSSKGSPSAGFTAQDPADEPMKFWSNTVTSNGKHKAALRSVVGHARGGPQQSVHEFTTSYYCAPPLTRIDTERSGVPGGLVKDMAKSMGITHIRMFEVIGLPKATGEKRAADNSPVTGSPGQSALGIVRLLGLATEMAASSNAKAAESFDAAKWLGQWIERSQPALGGRKPAELLDTPTGVETVVKLLGAIESGVYL